jgi:hypothetical protein
MENFKFINKITLKDVPVEEITSILQGWEFKVLLQHEDMTRDVDIMLDNMLQYFVEEELYEWACFVRDEIKSRELEPRKKQKPIK